jgi:hypothetical protein
VLPVCAKVSVLAPFVPFERTTCIVQESVALADPFQYLPDIVEIGEDCATVEVAAVGLSRVSLPVLTGFAMGASNASAASARVFSTATAASP